MIFGPHSISRKKFTPWNFQLIDAKVGVMDLCYAIMPLVTKPTPQNHYSMADEEKPFLKVFFGFFCSFHSLHSNDTTAKLAEDVLYITSLITRNAFHPIYHSCFALVIYWMNALLVIRGRNIQYNLGQLRCSVITM